MSQTTRRPKYYRPGLATRIVEGLRYGGGIGQWSWLLHRLTGIGVMLFLVIHVVDTFFVVAYPGLYDHTLSLYGGRAPWAIDEAGQPIYYWSLRWLFRIGELGLIAAVAFHSINGVRVALIDIWPGAVRHHRAMFWWVVGVFTVFMLVATFFVFRPLAEEPEFWNFPSEHAAPPSPVVAR